MNFSTKGIFFFSPVSAPFGLGPNEKGLMHQLKKKFKQTPKQPIKPGELKRNKNRAVKTCPDQYKTVMSRI